MPTVEVSREIKQRVAVNLDACIECRSCAAACFYGHNDLPVLYFARVGAAMLPAFCRQCEDAPCIAACTNGAMRKDSTGAVYRAVFSCRGCCSCAEACPFGILGTETFMGEIARCDLCQDQIEDGQLPRCVASCPSGALQFIEEPEAEALGLVVLGSRTLGQHPIRRR